jgi:hypothetical protein
MPIMRFLKYMFVTICCLVAVGCFEVDEVITINEDGSGVYNSKMDMSQLLILMESFAGEEGLKSQGLDKIIDTTIRLGSLLDSVKDISDDQKDLLKSGTMSLKMNYEEQVFKFTMDVPYKSQDNLQQLLQGGGNGTSALAQVLKQAFQKPGESSASAPAGDPQLGDVGAIYDVTIKNGLISKKLNEEKAKALFDNPEIQQLKQMSSAGMELLYTTTIHLPRPVKNVDNAVLKLSDDKKTVTLKYNLLDLIEDPSKYSYTIEY